MSARATRSRPARGTAAAPLVYWLLLVSGLALLTVARFAELEKVAPLWVGSVMGTAVGQLLARSRLRPWLVAFVVGNLMWLGPLTVLPFWQLLGAHPWAFAETAIAAFAPAAACGYLSLTERGTLAAFWFPAVLWMLSILDRDGASLAAVESRLLLGVLGVLFVGLLWARERRRVAEWQTHALQRLSAPRRRVVLREAPLRSVGQVGWMGATLAGTLILTTWIAPHLWHREKAESRNAAAPPVAGQEGGGNGPSCCPEGTLVDVKRERVTEYFPLLPAHDTETTPAAPSTCVACRDGVPIGGKPPEGTPATTSGATAGPAGGHGGASSHASPSSTVVATVTEAPPAPVASAVPWVEPPPVVAAIPPQASPAPKAPSAVAEPLLWPIPATGKVAVHPRVRPAEVPRPSSGGSLAGLAALVLAGVLLHLGLRPLRRLVTLRHLGRPLWPETVDQRVSNLWQLALVGLRDAGWHAVPGEQPRELARRVGLEGLKTCAAVLERARHGVRVEVADLEAMERAARSVYRAARERAGWAGRTASLLRWPLV